MAGESIELVVTFPAMLKTPVRDKLRELCRRFGGEVADEAPADSQLDAAAPLTDHLVFAARELPVAEAEIVEALDELEAEFDVDIQRPETGPIRISILRRRT